MAYTSGGRVSFVDKGEYSASVTYKRLDYVTYDNALYICKQTCVNQTPGDSSTYWTKAIDTNIQITDSEWNTILALYN